MSLDMHLFRVDLALAAVGLVAIFVLASEAGYRLGLRFASHSVNDAVRSQFATIEGAEFALVGLLLAFTFSMAATRHESRKLVIVAEANAIGTAWLRADVLPPEQCRQLRSLMRQYMDAWFELADSGRDARKWDPATRKGADLQKRMWAISAEECRRNPDSVAASLLLSSLNDVFDRHGDSRFAFANRLPAAILVLVIVSATIAVGHLGYGYGMAGRRNFATLVILCCLIVVTIIVIMDLDRPLRGMFQITPQSMIDLYQGMPAGEQ